MSDTSVDKLFDRLVEFPDMGAMSRYNSLIGIDEAKTRLEKLLGLLISPQSLMEWKQKYHPGADKLIERLLRRPPLVILAGDVGTGKTELGETIGDAVSRRSDRVPITLYPMSLSARGSGRVGEMTQLISSAFDLVYKEAKKFKKDNGASGGIILLVDEADALAQSRENAQMHHEDRAGVNAFVRGVDRIAESKLPAAVIMCTNRLSALDPAIQRRACEIFIFKRPNAEERRRLLTESLEGVEMSASSIDQLAELTGVGPTREYGFTYSDITQRLIPAIVLNAYPDRAITTESTSEVVETIQPTPPFEEEL